MQVPPQHVEDGRNGLKTMHRARAALLGEEGSGHADVRPHVEHNVALLDLDPVLQIASALDDLLELVPELRRIGVV